MAISAGDVKKLREITGAGMMDCKKALTEADGDMEKAQELLREKGLAAAQKKAGRIAAEGVVEAYIADNFRTGVLLEVNCETDFVANTPEFKSFVRDIAEHIEQSNPEAVSTEDETTRADGSLLDQKFIKNPDITIQDYVNEKIGKMGEKITVRRFTRYQVADDAQGVVDAYIHGGGRIGVLIEVDCENKSTAESPEFRTFVRDLAMHVAATNPMYLSEQEIEPSVLAKEKEILTVQAQNEGKPENVVAKMVEGRIRKFKKEICLLDQPFVKDPDLTVQDYVNEQSEKTGEKITICRYTRYEMGEGLEKRQDDFAKEVAAQTAK